MENNTTTPEMNNEEFLTWFEKELIKKREDMIEDVLWDFKEKITPRLKARMMKTPLFELRGKLENLRQHYLDEYSKL